MSVILSVRIKIQLKSFFDILLLSTGSPKCNNFSQWSLISRSEKSNRKVFVFDKNSVQAI